MHDLRYREEEVEPGLMNDPLGLLRGCLLRAIGWSVLAGTVLGAGATILMAVRGYSVGVLTTSASWVGGMTIIGAAQGAILGLVVGVASGLAIAAVTLVDVVTRRRVRWYRHLVGAVGAVVTVLGVWGGRQFFGVPFPLLVAGPGELVLGLALAGLGGWWVGDRVARWCIAETAGWDQV
jgi:hypothetical protein